MQLRRRSSLSRAAFMPGIFTSNILCVSTVSVSPTTISLSHAWRLSAEELLGLQEPPEALNP